MFAKQQLSQSLGRIRLAGLGVIFLLAFWASPQPALAGGGGECADYYFMDCSTESACNQHKGNMCIADGCNGTIVCEEDPECPEEYPVAMLCAIGGGSGSN